MTRPHLRVVGEEDPLPTHKPRPSNMFQYPQESALSPMRDKLLFIEELTADRDLTRTELRIAILLTTHYSTTNGYAKPSMDRIAAALGIDKSNVAKAINSLAAKGWFFVEHGNFRLGGKGHVNHYRPNPERVASATPFAHAASRTCTHVQNPKGGKIGAKGGNSAPQRVAPAPTDTGTLDASYTDTAVLRTAPCSQSKDAHAHKDVQRFVAVRKLDNWERWIKAGSDRSLTPSERKTVETWLAECDQFAETYDAHTGDPVGGRAYRLSMELAWLLESKA
jgi:hypothetical protein